MIADNIYSLYFIYDICDTIYVTAIKRSVCTVFAECVGVSVVDSLYFVSFQLLVFLLLLLQFNYCLPGVAIKLHINYEALLAFQTTGPPFTHNPNKPVPIRGPIGLRT